MDCILCNVRGFTHDNSSIFGFICDKCGEYEVSYEAVKAIKVSYDWIVAGNEDGSKFVDNLKTILKEQEKKLILRCHVEHAVNNASKR